MKIKYLKDYEGAKKDQTGHVTGSKGRWLVRNGYAVEIDAQGKEVEVKEEPEKPKATKANKRKNKRKII